MILKNLVEIFKTFDKEEKKKFVRFINSEYYNTNKRVPVLYKALLEQSPELDISKINKEEIYSKLYGGEKFNAKTYSYLFSELYRLADLFVYQRCIEKEAYEINNYTINGYMERKLFKHAEKKIDSSIRDIMEKGGWDPVYFQNLSQLHTLRRSNMIASDIYIKQDERHNEYYIYFIISRLDHVAHSLVTKKINYNIDTDSHIEDAFIKNLNIEELLKHFNEPVGDAENLTEKEKIHVAMQIPLKMIATLIDAKEEKHFRDIKVLLEKYSGIFSHNVQYNYYSMLETCCTMKKSSISYDKYTREYFELKKAVFAKGLYSYEDGYMPVRNFRSIAQVAVSLGEYEWAKDFIEEYIDKVSPEHREEIYNFMHADICFIEKKYIEALEYINKIDFKYDELKRFVKNLTLKIYYELNYTEQAYSLIDSYRHFLDKNKFISEHVKTPNKNFLVFAKDLLNLKLNPDEYGIVQLKDKIAAADSVGSKMWLLEKVDELIIGYNRV